MKKNNILIISAFLGNGGEEEIAYYIYENLNRDSNNVYIAGAEQAPYFQKYAPKNEEWLKMECKGKLNFSGMRLLRAFIKEKKIELVHVHGYSAGYFVRMACINLKDVIVVWSMHLNMADVTTMNSCKRWLSVNIENLLNKHFTDHIVSVSNESKIQLEKRNKGKLPITVIYNGVDIEKFSSNETSEVYKDNDSQLVLGFISRLSVQKNIPLLLNAFNALAKEELDVKLVIAGEGEEENYLKQFIINKNLENKIIYLGFKKNVSEILNAVDVILLPSLFECFPVIILESLCSQTPVIASSVNGIPEIIRDNYNGFLIRSGSIEDLVNKVKKYYFDRTLIKIHGKNGSQLIKNDFTKEQMIKKHEMLYQELIDKTRK